MNFPAPNSYLHHHQSGEKILTELHVNPALGLTAEVVAQRYEQYGRNELKFKPGKPAWLRFLLQFHQPLLYILLIAGTVKAFLDSWTNAWVIWGVTLVNAIIGYIQEAKAEGAIALQIGFSQLSFMNVLFKTAPMDWQQWAICLLPMIPMVPVAILANRLDP